MPIQEVEETFLCSPEVSVVGVPRRGMRLDDGVGDLEGSAEGVLHPRGVHANAVPMPGRADRLIECYPPLHLHTGVYLCG